jgi:hypothetical protein
MLLTVPALAIASNLMMASAKACMPDQAEVRIETRVGEPRIDKTRSAAQLQAMQADGSIVGNQRFAKSTGLTVGGITVDSEIRIANDTAEDGTVCAWPSVVTVTLATAPTVYLVANEAGCQQTVGLQHEMEHVAIDRRIVQRYAAIFRFKVSTMAYAIAADTLRGRDLRTQRQRIEEKINAMIAIISDEMNEDRASEQRAFDSVEEYTRVNSACPDLTIHAR